MKVSHRGQFNKKKIEGAYVNNRLYNSLFQKRKKDYIIVVYSTASNLWPKKKTEDEKKFSLYMTNAFIDPRAYV
jgi:hypothetical protein